MSRYYGNLESNINYFLINFEANCNIAMREVAENPSIGALAMAFKMSALSFLGYAIVLRLNDPDGVLLDDPFDWHQLMVMSYVTLMDCNMWMARLVVTRTVFELLRRIYFHIVDVPREMLGPIHRRPDHSYVPLPTGLSMTLTYMIKFFFPKKYEGVEIATFIFTFLITFMFVFEAALRGLVTSALSVYTLVACLAKDFVNTGIFLCGEIRDIMSGNRNH